MMILTERQKKFCDEYIANSGNGAAAARSAGYSARGAKVTAAKLLANTEIKTEIDNRLDSLQSELIADEREILEILTSVVRGETTDEVVTNTGKKFELRTNTATRLKAGEMLLKVFGSFNRREKENQQPTFAEWFMRELEKAWADEQADVC